MVFPSSEKKTRRPILTYIRIPEEASIDIKNIYRC